MTLCECGCGLHLGSRNKSGFRIGHKEALEHRLLESGCRPPRKWITCEYCGEETPRVTNGQQCCSATLTGKQCQSNANRLKRLRAYSKKAKREKLFRQEICLTPSVCRNYASGTGCPHWVVPCTDRLEEPWEWEKLSLNDQELRACRREP